MAAQAWVDVNQIDEQTANFRKIMAERIDEIQTITNNSELNALRMELLSRGEYYPTTFNRQRNNRLLDVSCSLIAMLELGRQSVDGRILIGEAERKIIKTCSVDPTTEINEFIERNKKRIEWDIEFLKKQVEHNKAEPGTVHKFIEPEETKSNTSNVWAIVGIAIIIGVMILLGVSK